jgi:hypothetical protein
MGRSVSLDGDEAARIVQYYLTEELRLEKRIKKLRRFVIEMVAEYDLAEKELEGIRRAAERTLKKTQTLDNRVMSGRGAVALQFMRNNND